MNDTFGPINYNNFTNNITNNFNNNNKNHNEHDADGCDCYFLIALFPIILVMFIAIVMALYVYVWGAIINIIKYIKNKINVYRKSFNSPIVNNKLNKKYIKKLNNDNKQNIDNTNQCPICFKDINIKDKILVLDCGHPFCINCAQDWVKTKVSNGQTPDCPMCRSNIIRESDIKKDFVVINLDYDSDSSNVSLFEFYGI